MLNYQRILQKPPNVADETITGDLSWLLAGEPTHENITYPNGGQNGVSIEKQLGASRC